MSAVVSDKSGLALRVAETDAAIQQELAALLERIGPLTAGCDVIAASFLVLKVRWQADAGQLHAALAEIAATVGEAR